MNTFPDFKTLSGSLLVRLVCKWKVSWKLTEINRSWILSLSEILLDSCVCVWAERAELIVQETQPELEACSVFPPEPRVIKIIPSAWSAQRKQRKNHWFNYNQFLTHTLSLLQTFCVSDSKIPKLSESFFLSVTLWLFRLVFLLSAVAVVWLE